MACGLEQKQDAFTRISEYVKEHLPAGWSFRLVFTSEWSQAILVAPDGTEITDFYSPDDPGTTIDACQYAKEYDG